MGRWCQVCQIVDILTINSGKLGHGDENNRLTPVFLKVLQGKKVTKASMGYSHTLLLDDTNTIYGMGSHENGQLGLGENAEKKNLTPLAIFALTKYKCTDVECGQYHSGAITNNGTVVVFGKGDDVR